MNTVKESHPCQYCSKPCFGRQCKECHLKMIQSQQSNCQDCDIVFAAQRRDGTKRKRCMDCQEKYINKYISICPDCKNSYHALLDDGRFFEKCYTCYKKSFHNCEKCEKQTKDIYSLCRDCYFQDKQIRLQKECSICNDFTCQECRINYKFRTLNLT